MSSKEQDLTKIVLSTHRVSYVHLKEPSSYKNSDKKDYSIEFLIPYDHPDVARIDAALQHVYKANRDGIFKGAKFESKNFHNPLVDGEDILDENPKREEVIGMCVIKGKSSKQPAVFDADGSELYDLDDVYGGCYCRGVIVFRPFSHESGKKGISCYINSVKFMKDGEPLGGFTATHEDYEDEAPSRGRGRAAEAPARGRRAVEDVEPTRARRRSSEEEPADDWGVEDEAPRRRRAAPVEEDEAPRRRRAAPAAPAPRGRRRAEEDEDDLAF